jgi:hypothetical protein
MLVPRSVRGRPPTPNALTDILCVVCSIHTRPVSAHDVIRMLQRDGRPTQLGEAFGMYGRIFKTSGMCPLSSTIPRTGGI